MSLEEFECSKAAPCGVMAQKPVSQTGSGVGWRGQGSAGPLWIRDLVPNGCQLHLEAWSPHSTPRTRGTGEQLMDIGKPTEM